MTMYVMKNRTTKNQLGIAVSKKFAKSSVRRNRVKRLIKEVYRLQESNLVSGISILFLWKNQVPYEEVSFENVTKDFEKCMKKANLWKIEEEWNA